MGWNGIITDNMKAEEMKLAKEVRMSIIVTYLLRMFDTLFTFSCHPYTFIWSLVCMSIIVTFLLRMFGRLSGIIIMTRGCTFSWSINALRLLFDQIAIEKIDFEKFASLACISH
ncbi:Uncharacterised protein r2_g3221 [Pycnogonum litorale]